MCEMEKYMRRCLQLARLGEYYVAPNPMVGAVLVSADGVIIGEGFTAPYGGPHAERRAFADHDLRFPGVAVDTLVVSLEPCCHYGKTPPCADLIIRRGVRRVVVGCLDPNPLVAGKGIEKLRNAGIEVVTGVLEQHCQWVNRRFICLHKHHRPYVILKWAQTADGFMAYLPQGEGEQPRLHVSTDLTKRLVHRMRAENMAIMVGTQTVINDNPRLLCTHWSGRNPIRVTLDRHHRLNPESRIFSDEAPTIVYSDDTDWRHVTEDLASRGIHSVLVEGGARLLEHIIDTDIYDELHVEVGEQTIGQGVMAPKVELKQCRLTQIRQQRLYEWTRQTPPL